MASGPLGGLLQGVVEIDETYIGAGNRRGTNRGRPVVGGYKTPVVALVERGGRVRAFPMERITGENVKAALTKHISKALIVTGAEGKRLTYKQPTGSSAN